MTYSLAALPDGKVLGGTSTRPANGGVKKAEGDAELYILDISSKGVKWHDALIPDAGAYQDMIVGPDGKVFGTVDNTILFVFDPAQRKIVHRENLTPIIHKFQGRKTAGAAK